jgi:hypothetical protein
MKRFCIFIHVLTMMSKVKAAIYPNAMLRDGLVFLRIDGPVTRSGEVICAR